MLRSLITTVGLAAVTGQIAGAVRRASRRAGLAAAAGIMWLIAFAFGVAAFTVWLSDKLGVFWALTIVAGIFAVVGICLSVALALTANRQNQSSFQQQLAGMAAPAAAGAAGTGSMLGSLAFLAVVGWLLGRQMGGKK
jgi:hypothetical protein